MANEPQPFLGEIMMFGGLFAPEGWMYCKGQLLAIDQNNALYTLIGTTFGGDGSTTFALPDLQGRVPIGQGPAPGLPTYTLGEAGGEELHTLNTPEMPTHSHAVAVTSTTSDANTNTPGNTTYIADETLSGTSGVFIYAPGGPRTSLAPQTVSMSPGGTAHPNVQPVLGVAYCIAITGLYPAQD